MIKLGIIGIGNMGTVHSKNIFEGKCPEIELSAVCDLKDEKVEWIKNEHPEVAIFKDAEEMMDSGKIDSVLICVPHYDHPKYAIMAMKKGLHTLVEKPAGVYTKHVLEMNKVADECDVVFGIMMNQRTNCVYRKMRELIQSGEFGKIRRANWIITDWYRPQAYYDSGDWRATWSGEGGGVLLNQCPHNLDLYQWICGMPTKVHAKMFFGKHHDIEVEDDVTSYWEFENGATGTFITSTGDVPGTNRLEVLLEGAKLLCEDGKVKMWKLEMFESEFSRTNEVAFAAPKMEYIEVETDGKNEQHVGVLNAFAGAILRGEPLVADGREGINGLTISNALHMSGFLGKEIEIKNFDHDLFYEELKKRIATSRRKEKVNENATVNMGDSFR
jgi:predicted dehydrogenase